MARSSSLVSAVVLSLFCTGTVYIYLSKDDIYNGKLANLRELGRNYSTNHGEPIRKLQSLGGANQESSEYNYEIEGEEDEDEYDNLLLSEYEENYDKLCRGEISLPTKIQKKLKCQYIDRSIPFLKLAPFKEEELYLDPRIVLYHDVLYEEEIETLKRLSQPVLEKAKVFSYTGDDEVEGGRESRDRNAESGFIYDDEDEHVELLNRRIEYMTELTVDSAEALQIAYYEIGGFFLPHLDYISKGALYSDKYIRESGIGDRIATVLFYMNEVEEGGATVFNLLNLTIWPKKGSALFWYNLKRNGDGDELTVHGACQVFSGTKWIATKWLHEIGQEFRRPCSLFEDE